MSILNVNQIQPVGGGNTITVSASDISASGATITATSFVGPLTGAVTGNVTGNLTGNVTGNVTSSSTSTFSSGINVTGGRVLVGTTDAGSNGTADDLVVANNSSASDQAGISIRGGTSGRSQIFFSDGTSGQDEYRGMLRYDHSENSMQFRTDAAERLRITSAGNVQITDGNLVLASGHGIDFSATSDTTGMSSELLDDYEEGIHTVAFSASTGGTVTVSSGDDQISYVKIGNHVTVTGRPVVTSVSSPQGNLRMTLPFTSSDLSDAAGRAACALNVRLLNSGYKVGMMNAYLDEGSNLLSFSYGDNNDSQYSAPAIKSGTQIWINISYRTV